MFDNLNYRARVVYSPPILQTSKYHILWHTQGPKEKNVPGSISKGISSKLLTSLQDLLFIARINNTKYENKNRDNDNNNNNNDSSEDDDEEREIEEDSEDSEEEYEDAVGNNNNQNSNIRATKEKEVISLVEDQQPTVILSPNMKNNNTTPNKKTSNNYEEEVSTFKSYSRLSIGYPSILSIHPLLFHELTLFA